MKKKLSDFSRRGFLKASTLLGLGTSLAGCSATKCLVPVMHRDKHSNPDEVPARPTGQKPVHDLATKPLEKIRVGVIGLRRGMVHVQSALNIEFAEVVAVCDLRQERADEAADVVEKKTGKRPAIYGGTE